MATPKSGKLPKYRMSPLKEETERYKKMQGPPAAPPPPGKDMFKIRNKKGAVIRALAGASVPPSQKVKKS